MTYSVFLLGRADATGPREGHRRDEHASITTTSSTYCTRKSTCPSRPYAAVLPTMGLAVRLTLTASNAERQLSTDKPCAAG
jgi:hypothetical protein